MSAAPAIMFTAHEAIARDLLARLLEETERAREVATDMEAFDSLLAARSEMLEALDRSVQALAATAQQARGAGTTAARETLIGLANELERANTTLMHSVRAERDLIAAAIAASDRPDTIASRYSGSAPTEVHRLNLIR